MNLFGLGIDSKIEDVLIEVGCNNRLWNILMWGVNYPNYDDMNVTTMRDLVNMPKENILNVRNLGKKGVDEIKSIFEFCGINEIKDWKNL